MGDETQNGTGEEDVGDDWGAAMAEQEDSEAAVVEKADMETLVDEGGGGETVGERSMDIVLDIPVTMSVEIGRTKISINNLLKLNQGSVVELDRLAGEPMDVMVNGTLIAHGEVVVVNEKFGIRVTDIISAIDRVKNLK